MSVPAFGSTPHLPAESSVTSSATPSHVVQCAVCGVERDSTVSPTTCPICADPRQYLAPDGVPHWVNPAEFAGQIELYELEPCLWALKVLDGVGIGQQAKIIVTDQGLVMVDAPCVFSAKAASKLAALGPLKAIMATHPHMYGVQSLWSRAFDNCPVFVSVADQAWLGLKPGALHLWQDQIELVPGVTALQVGGHFPGSCVVYWPGQDGKGVLLAGDTIMANPDRKTMSFMWSYPNRIPLSGRTVEAISHRVKRFEFDRLYSNFELAITAQAKERVMKSAVRHAAWVRGDFDDRTGPYLQTHPPVPPG